MKLSRFALAAGAAALGLSLLPSPFGPFSSLSAHTQANDDDDDDELEDDGAVDDQDGDVTDDDQIEATPDAEEEAEWAEDAETAEEQQAEQVDADDYITKCREQVECQATLNFIESELKELLQSHSQRPPRHPRNATQAKVSNSKVAKYRVLPGQKLRLAKGRVGANDIKLWSQVTQVLPRAQTDNYFGSFWVDRKKDKKEGLLAYVQGEEDTNKFLLNMNEPNHLETDLREQYLTVVHEFMHMVVLRQADGEQVYDQGSRARISTADIRSARDALRSLFGSSDEAAEEVEEDAEDEEQAPCDGVRDEDSCFASDTLYAKFVRKFWTRADLEADRQDEHFYEQNKTRFVTEYATSTPHEDISESFSYWVIAEGKGNTVADAKQRFFGRFPKLVALKEHIRRAVIADILKDQALAAKAK